MKRSSEFMRSKGMSSPKEELSHMRVHPAETLGGKVKVEHMMVGKHGVGAVHEFGPEQHEAFMEHMSKHSGLEGAGGEPEAHSNKAVGGLEEE